MTINDLQISSQHIELTEDYRSKIEERFQRLADHSFKPILHARAEVVGSGHHRHGSHELRLTAVLPREQVQVKKSGELSLPLITRAFDALERRLQEKEDVRAGRVKSHEDHVQHGTVFRLLPEEHCGFIQAEGEGGLAVYFHWNALKDTDTLEVGQRVTFHAESGDKGPQAVWVKPARPR